MRSNSLHQALHARARLAPISGIMDVVNYGAGRDGLIPLWAGEGDLPTPDFICEAANRSLKDGETFYTRMCGIPELQQALADYHIKHYDRRFTPDRFTVTGSGMQSIQVAIASVVGEGEDIIVPSPAWPNFEGALVIAGAKCSFLPMEFSDAGWTLTPERVEAAIGEKTRAIFLNSPSNPTGWMASQDELAAFLDIARRHDLWIIADEVYNRFVFSGSRAPSFYDVMEDNDRILFVNTFSKNWAMTGWRIGWISAPPELGETLENLVHYSTSGVATFMQRAAITALTDGEPFVEEQVRRSREGREIVCSALGASNAVSFGTPEGAFYLFFGLEGFEDTQPLGRMLVDEANIGVVPGAAFGPGGEAFVRLCFQRSPDQLREAMDRLTKWLAGRAGG